MSITLKLEGATDTLDLNGILKVGTGFQALVGATGLGLPPVTPQWLEGAGDGAIYRGRRVRSREIDLPLDILGRDRAHLKELTSRLAKVLSEPAELVITDSTGDWSTKVVRSGGGGFQYGIDTTGARDLQLVLTLTAGDPYFTQRTVSQGNVSTGTATPFLDAMVTLPLLPGQVLGNIQIINSGDAEAFPVWTVYGPGSDFEVVSPKGEVLRWEGTLLVGETLTFDTRKATVTDHTGASRYSELATAPRFWSVPPGTTTSQAQLLGADSNSNVVCNWQARKWMVI